MSLARIVGRNALFTALSRGFVLLVWFLLTPGILETLGPDRFGFWSILLVLTGSFAALDLGLGPSVTRFVAEINARGARGALRPLVLRALRVQGLIAFGVVALGLLSREAVLDWFHVPPEWESEARAAYLAALGGFVLALFSNLLMAAIQGLQRMDRAFVATLPAAAVLFAGILWAMRSPSPLFALVLVQTAYGVLLTAFLALQFVRAAREATMIEGARADIPFARVLSLGSWIQLGAVLALVQTQMDKILLGTSVGLAPAGAYEISSRILAVATLPALLFLGALFPAMAEREHVHRGEGRQDLYRAALGPYLLGVFALAGALVALAGPLLEAWLGRPPEGAPFMLRILSLVALVTLATGVASTLRRAAERAELEVAYGLFNVGLHLVLSLAGLRLFGWPGILYGTAVAALVSSVWFLARVERWLGWAALAETARASAPAVAATVPAAVAAALVASALSGLPSGRARGILAFAAGAGSFAVVFAAVIAAGFPTLAGSLRRRVWSILGRA